MQNSKWIGFGLTSAISRSCMHFFPAADSVTAPYPAGCSLAIFRNDIPRRAVMLEGGRLSNPDGVWIEDAFPSLKNEITGLFGLEVEMMSVQQRLDLNGSGCVIEVVSQGFATRYWPARPATLPRQDNGSKEGEQTSQRICWNGIAYKDNFHSCSLIVVNGSDVPAGIEIIRTPAVSAQTPNGSWRIEAGPRAVVEHDFEPALYQGVQPQECSWGTIRAVPVKVYGDLALGLAPAEGASRSLRLEQENQAALACYLVYRDNENRRIVSVMAL